MMKPTGILLTLLVLQSTLAAKIKHNIDKAHNQKNNADSDQGSPDPFHYNPKKIANIQHVAATKPGSGGFHHDAAVATATPQKRNPPARNQIQQYAIRPKATLNNLDKNGPRRNHVVQPLRNIPRPAPRVEDGYAQPDNAYVNNSPSEPKNNQIHQQQSHFRPSDRQEPQRTHKRNNANNLHNSDNVIQNRHDVIEPNYEFHDQNFNNAGHHVRQAQQYRPNFQNSGNRFNNDNYNQYSIPVKTHFRRPISKDLGSFHRPSASKLAPNPYHGGNNGPKPRGRNDFNQPQKGTNNGEPQKGCKLVEKEVKDLPQDGNNNNGGRRFSSKRYMMVKQCFYDNDQPFRNGQKQQPVNKFENDRPDSKYHGQSSPFEYNFNDDDFFKDYFSNDGQRGPFRGEFSQDHFFVQPFRF